MADSLGFNEMEFLTAHWYFDIEGFFEINGDELVSLSHRGIVEIERTIKNPKQSTEHFSTTVIQHFNAPIGSVQTGNNNVSNVNQNVGQNFSKILEHLAILRNHFQSSFVADKEEAIDIIDDFEKEVVKETPNKRKIKKFLISTKDFAVKTGTELASSTLAKLLESQMGIKG